jgi:NhaA family Na+:H+ antiporter
MADPTATQTEASLPSAPIQRITRPLADFLHVEAAGGLVLVLASGFALALANSPLSEQYLAIWKTEFSIGFAPQTHSLKHWISDGLMVIFFFVIGLEVKREMVLGELRDFRKAVLPIAAAIGGMLVPAAIYLSLQLGEPGERGWGIPMATDIAFVVGCMAVLGRRVPAGLRVLLLSLAIADDIGAIVVIAVGYTETIDWEALAWAIGGIGLTYTMMRAGVRNIALYAVVGIEVWLGFHASGVHATIAGVILGLMTPADRWVSQGRLHRVVGQMDEFLHGEWDLESQRRAILHRVQTAAREATSPLERLEHSLHPWVSFGIIPAFALANAGVPFQLGDLGDPVSVAAMLGLFLGKPIGIFAASFLAVKAGWARLPDGVNWGVVLGGGFLAGIGFTMSLFIAMLALDGPTQDVAKVGILAGSILSGIVGMGLLVWLLPSAPPAVEEPAD